MANVAKRCNCRQAETGKKLGQKCPDLSKQKHGAWWVRYEAPPSPGGKRRRPWAGPYATKTEADTAGKRLETEADSGKPIPDRQIKVGPFLRQWLAGKKKLAQSTRAGYLEHIVLYLEPGLGHHRMAALAEEHLGALYEAMEQINRPEKVEGKPSEMLRRLLAAREKAEWEGARPGQMHNSRPLSPARIRRVHATLSSALTTAKSQGKIDHDPSKHIELAEAKRRRPLLWTPERVARWRERLAAEAAKEPADRRPVPRPAPVMVWTPVQAGGYLDFLEEEDVRLYALFHLVTTRALRRAEVCHLEWEDTDLASTKTISVLEEEEAGEEDGIKSESSRRVISLDAVNVRLLKAWRKIQAADRLAAGKQWVDSGKVFTDELGRELVGESLSDLHDRLVRRSGLPPVRFHDLRHCAATIMLAAGVDMKVVSATLGHRKFWFTADTYTLVVPELAEAAAEATVALIPRKRGRPRKSS